MSDDSENVRVVVRCRPLLSDDNERGEESCVQVLEKASSINIKNRQFTFDHVFGFATDQLDVYQQAAKSIVDFVLQGYNGTIFAYGQTGTGKTFTSSGILSHAFAHIFGYIHKSANDTQFLVRASFYEIYNEEIRDLLNKTRDKPLELKENAQGGVYVKNLSCFVVNNVAELERLKLSGEKTRAMASTNMNKRSSRSHTIFTITVEAITGLDPANSTLRVGKLNLVDLAGSERQSKTGTTGDRLKEAAKINLSLTSLSLVIAALTDPKAAHIPYRNSKLTRILADSLGGNSKTLLIACIGPAASNLEESLSTLRFASSAKRIKNRAVVNEDEKDALLRKFQQQIAELKRQLEEDGGGGDDATNGNSGNDGNTTTAASIAGKVGGDGAHETSVGPPPPRELLDKLNVLQSKIMVGGENLLEKVELQEKLLAETEAQLQEQRDRERALEDALQAKRAEHIQIEESYGTLQEEVAALDKKLKKVFNYLVTAKGDLTDMQEEHAKLREDLLDSIRTTNREINLGNTLIGHFIPESYVDLIVSSASYSETLGEWQLKCMAYTGNNVLEQLEHSPRDHERVTIEDDSLDVPSVYLHYKR